MVNILCSSRSVVRSFVFQSRPSLIFLLRMNVKLNEEFVILSEHVDDCQMLSNKSWTIWVSWFRKLLKCPTVCGLISDADSILRLCWRGLCSIGSVIQSNTGTICKRFLAFNAYYHLTRSFWHALVEMTIEVLTLETHLCARRDCCLTLVYLLFFTFLANYKMY